MNLARRFLVALAVAATFPQLSAGPCSGDDVPRGEDKYQPTWTSLRNHRTPDWLRDAKFGVYCHWGIWTIRYANERDPLTFDQEIERFKAEKFDPAAWAALFVESGARFAGPVAWHGSPFVNWDSELTEYNAGDRGPRVDIVGELEREIRNRGLKFMVSYHCCFDENWIRFAKEGIDRYHPDLFWLDAGFGGTKKTNHDKHTRDGKYVANGAAPLGALPERYQREFLAYFFNDAERRGADVECTYKSTDIPPGIGMRDLENGLLDHLPYDTWITDIDIYEVPDWKTHGWFYREGIKPRSANRLVDLLVDVVSKNGVMLLNVGPMADGTFSNEARESLLGVGEWLKINGEAVYGASPWFLFGEGPTDVPEGHHSDHFATLELTNKDIRFTTNGEYLYAICLGWPDSETRILSLGSNFKLAAGDITSVTLLGSDEELVWRHTPTALVIEQPKKKVSDHAAVFKIGRK